MCRCLLGLADKIFLAHYVRPLFTRKDSDPSTIRDGLTNTVVTAGVVVSRARAFARFFRCPQSTIH